MVAPVAAVAADVVAVPVAEAHLEVQVALGLVPVAAVVPDPAVVAGAVRRVPSGALVDARFAEGSPSARSARNSNRCRRHHSVASRFRAVMAQPPFACGTVRLGVISPTRLTPTRRHWERE